MRSCSSPFLFTLLLSNLLAACGGDIQAPDASRAFTTLEIITDQQPVFVAFRDGLDSPASWERATMRAPIWFEAEVHGPYVVTVVCADTVNDKANQPAHRSRTLQIAGTLSDARRLDVSCGLSAMGNHEISGSMIPSEGQVQLGSSNATASDGQFKLFAANGLYDLIATADDRVVVRREVEINDEHTTLPLVDLEAEVPTGTSFDPVSFTVANKADDEMLAAEVYLLTSRTPVPAQVITSRANPNDTQFVAKIMPSSLLNTTDTQIVAVQAAKDTASRAALRELRRPFRKLESSNLASSAVMFTLPDALGSVQFSTARGPLSTSWATLPELDHLHLSASSGDKDTKYDLSVTPLFLAELAKIGMTSIAIDIEIVGYQPEWKIDFNRPYTRALTTKHLDDDQLATSSVTETVNGQ